MNFLIIQLIGLIGTLFIVLSFQKNNRAHTLLFQSIAGLAFTAHFILLNAWTGAAMNITGSLRAYIFNKRESKPYLNRKIVMYLFIALFALAGIWTWKSYLSLLPIIAVTIECFALWSNNTKNLRWQFLTARPLWIVYNIFVGSYAGLATEAFIVSSLIIAIIRFDLPKKSDLAAS